MNTHWRVARGGDKIDIFSIENLIDYRFPLFAKRLFQLGNLLWGLGRFESLEKLILFGESWQRVSELQDKVKGHSSYALAWPSVCSAR